MFPTPKNFLEVGDTNPPGRKPRSRSSGHVDRIEEQERLERRDRDRRMREYHDSTRKSSTVHHRTKSDHLDIPIWETNRKPRPSEMNVQEVSEPPRSYRVQEVKPSSQLYNYDLDPELTKSSQLQAPLKERPSRSSKAQGKVPPIIIQGTTTSKSKTTGPSPNRSCSASPHSPTAQPLLQVQYARLQQNISIISDSCEKYLEVEPADPQDLSFAKIRETVDGFAEDLHIWSHVANLDGLARIDRNLRHLVDAASEVLDRLLDRVSELREACANAKPKDLKVLPMDKINDEDDVDLYDDGADCDDGDNSDLQDLTKTLGFIIQSRLHSIGMQIRHLKLLSASLQEATPDVEDEMSNIARLVKETSKAFGSEAATERY